MTTYAGRYSEDLQDRYGNGFRNAKVAVQTLSGDEATLYADRLKTAYSPTGDLEPNEVKADDKGNLQFFAEPENYQIVVTPAGGESLTPYPISIYSDPLEPLNVPTFLYASLPAVGNAGSIAEVTNTIRGLFRDTGYKWNKVGGSVVYVEDFRTTGATDETVITAAITAAGAARVPLIFDPITYETSVDTGFQPDNIPLIVAYGTTFKRVRFDLRTGPMVFLGGTIDQGVGTNTATLLTMRASNLWVQDVTAIPTEAQAAFRITNRFSGTATSNMWLVNCEGRGANDGLDIFSGQEVFVLGYKLSDVTDDGIVVKSVSTAGVPTKNVLISNFIGKNVGALCSIGDHNYFGIHNVKFVHGIGENIGRPISFRPGDTLGGAVGDATCTNIVVEDLQIYDNGTAQMKSPILLRPGFSGTFQNVRISKLQISGRFLNSSENYLAVLAATDAAASLKGVLIEDFSYFDPYGGVGNGVGGAPGYPIERFTTTNNLGTVDDVTVRDLVVNGCPDQSIVDITNNGTLGTFRFIRPKVINRVANTQAIVRNLHPTAILRVDSPDFPTGVTAALVRTGPNTHREFGKIELNPAYNSTGTTVVQAPLRLVAGEPADANKQDGDMWIAADGLSWRVRLNGVTYSVNLTAV